MAKNKRKGLITQSSVCSRMNYLYQAARLMADSHHNVLAAYYGKLCRNVGTKAQIHIAPALKRTLCKRCSLPLIPEVNTTLTVVEQSKRKFEPKEKILKDKSKKRKRHRPRHKKNVKIPFSSIEETPSDDIYVSLQQQCQLCQGQRRFVVDTRQPKECWLEQDEALDHVVTLQKDMQRNEEK